MARSRQGVATAFVADLRGGTDQSAPGSFRRKALDFMSLEIAIIAPFPAADRFLDGWMSRIKTIDIVLSHLPRTYIDFQEGYPADAEPELVAKEGRVTAYRVNPRSARHRSLVQRVLDNSSFVYIHTMHQVEYMLPYFDPDRMYADIHGVVPEEELMMGSPERSTYFGKIEAEFFTKAKRVGVVTRSMARHYKEKYPKSGVSDYIHLPVFDFAAAADMRNDLRGLFATREARGRDHAIYAGGAQVWQCVDLLLDAIKKNPNQQSFEIFSHNIDIFGEELKKRALEPSIFKGYVSKKQLADIYENTNFGFVLREDSIVNRAASPTKICDYCAGRVIPIVKFTQIGDFEEYGYAYVSFADYLDGFVPDAASQRWMVERNIACMETMISEFEQSRDVILSLAEAY